MSDLDTLKAIEQRYAKVLDNFKKFEAMVRIATTEPLRGATVAEVPGSSNYLDICVAGRWFRMTCSLQRSDMTWGLITCYSLDPFTRKVLSKVAEARFSQDGAVETKALHESMLTAEGAANIVAHLVIPGLEAQPQPLDTNQILAR